MRHIQVFKGRGGEDRGVYSPGFFVYVCAAVYTLSAFFIINSPYFLLQARDILIQTTILTGRPLPDDYYFNSTGRL